MSDNKRFLVNVYRNKIVFPTRDQLARKVLVLGADLKPKEVVLGPLLQVWLHSSRDLMVETKPGSDFGEVLVHTHQNNPDQLRKPWLKLEPTWITRMVNGRKVEILASILDSRGGKVRFTTT
jgi:hypothetical protein